MFASAPARAESARDTVCRLIERAAADNGLPVAVFTRLIWRESSFRPAVTSRAGAQGIAQFMPGTAAERKLEDPFDPEQAIPAAAALVADLSGRFGSLGLAAAAYNAGRTRVSDFLAGGGTLPRETRAYVAFVTGWSVDDWRSGLAEAAGVMQIADPGAGCAATVAAVVAETPGAAASALDEAVLPWGVQLAGGYGKDDLVATYARMRTRYAGVLAGHEPTLLPFRVGGAKPRRYYQLRVAFSGRRDATRLCRALRQAGGSCLVMRN
ncbi:lytic transglycosylase domain-containing protein [Oharaeibacter diazotrophicus]|uniref:lytic transglycosylase domain-containing protein n=1 Tax=Oharaeibacter diazotrophicus TaxID=1920512 RepID=UPI0024E16F9C|nr:lytic transglycosylase domain-containing protein [Oharaeibacter diazotrophicus]